MCRNSRLGSSGSEERRGRARRSAVNNMDGGRGERDQDARTGSLPRQTYMCPWYSVDVGTNHQGQRRISS